MKKHLLRSLLFSCVLCLTFVSSKAQWVSIPDANFRTWLNTHGYSSCMNGNFMDTTCTAATNAISVTCSNSSISNLSGIQYFDNLEYLVCTGNLLTTLPVLPAHLTQLSCYLNQITTLPTLPNMLADLECYNNQLDHLPALPASLRILNCFNNPLVTLPTLPDSLLTLGCGGDSLAYLPALPVTVKHIDCSYSPQLTTLPALSDSLQYLRCFQNNLTSLPVLPSLLRDLDCSQNVLTSLPSLPPALITLNCGYNQLSILPALPNSLRGLTCSGNQLITLPPLPNLLTSLNCQNNQLISIPELPDTLNSFYCAGNLNLHCLPQLKTILVFGGITGTGITCLPNYPNGCTSCFITTPLCDIFNANGCNVYWNVTGKVYADNNLNCSYNTGEYTFGNVKLQLYENGVLKQQTITTGTGEYSFNTDLSAYQYSVDTSNLPFVLACPDSGYHTSIITVIDSFDTDKNFGLNCKPGFDLAANGINGRFRPGRVGQVSIQAGDYSNFFGLHCANGTSGTVQLIINGSVHFVSPAIGALNPITVSNDTITWNVADFGTVNFFTDFNIMAQTDTTAQVGDSVCFTLIVNPILGDNNPANNILNSCFAIRNSYDPNEKEVYPIGNIDANDWLNYIIHFQNTGTDTAQHIYVTDTLDSNVDPASFQLLAYSHQPMVQIKENTVRFNYPNINLPDSNTNEPLSHGYVQYKVKLKNNLPLGTHINNTAFIYFDFNTPVVTNTTSNTITTSTGLRTVSKESLAFRIYPNPSSGSATISIDETMLGPNGLLGSSTASVYDLTGRKIAAVQLKTANTKLETSSFASGVYFVTVENEKGRVTRKLVIEK